MKKIVAIGGGENGRKGTAYETKLFDEQIIEMSGKSHPTILFVGLANRNPTYYYSIICDIFTKRYGCKVYELALSDLYRPDITREKIYSSDAIYIGGGNTCRLMRLVRKYGIHELLEDASEHGIVMSGVSAGAICWCAYGNSYSKREAGISNEIIRVSGMGMINILLCPHYLRDKDRAQSLMDMMRRTSKIPAIALDNAALVVNSNHVKILKLQKNPYAAKQFWLNGSYYEIPLETNCQYSLDWIEAKC